MKWEDEVPVNTFFIIFKHVSMSSMILNKIVCTFCCYQNNTVTLNKINGCIGLSKKISFSSIRQTV